MQPIPRQAYQKTMTRAELREEGVSAWQVRRCGLARPFHGVYADPRLMRRAQGPVRAALAAADSRALVGGVSGLRLLGVELPHPSGTNEVDLVIPGGVDKPRRAGLRCHQTTASHEPWRLIDGIPVAHPALCLLHAARHYDADDLVLLADALMRRRRPLLSLRELRQFVAALARSPGVPRLREAIARARPGTDTLDESRLRLAIVRAALPCPAVNFRVWCPEIGGYYVLDLAYPELHVNMEHDGASHDGGDRRAYDIERTTLLSLMGWREVRTTLADVGPRHPFIVDLTLKARAAALERGLDWDHWLTGALTQDPRLAEA
jgi:very-short-patch-repair endonuclease